MTNQMEQFPKGQVGSLSLTADVNTDPYRLFALTNPEKYPSAKQFSMVDATGFKRYYTLRFRPSTREQCWYLDIDDAATGERLISSVRLVPYVDLLTQYRHDRRLPAEVLFVASRSTSSGRVPGLSDLGVTDFLYHLRHDDGSDF